MADDAKALLERIFDDPDVETFLDGRIRACIERACEEAPPRRATRVETLVPRLRRLREKIADDREAQMVALHAWDAGRSMSYFLDDASRGYELQKFMRPKGGRPRNPRIDDAIDEARHLVVEDPSWRSAPVDAVSHELIDRLGFEDLKSTGARDGYKTLANHLATRRAEWADPADN